MPGQKIRADFEELTTIAAKWREQRDRVLTSKNNLQTRMNTLRNGDWEGDSAEVFYAEMDSVVMPALGRLVAALDDAAQTTLGIREVMAQAELDVAAIFKEREEGGAGKGKGLASAEGLPNPQMAIPPGDGSSYATWDVPQEWNLQPAPLSTTQPTPKSNIVSYEKLIETFRKV